MLRAKRQLNIVYRFERVLDVINCKNQCYYDKKWLHLFKNQFKSGKGCYSSCATSQQTQHIANLV